MTAAYGDRKESGIPWIGAVPAHWDVPHLGHVVTCLDSLRVPLNSAERAEFPGSIPYWGANGVVDTVERPLVEGSLVLLGEDGAPFGDRDKQKAFFVDGPIWPNNHIHVLRATPRVLPKYLTHFLNATDYSWFVEGSTRQKLTQAKMLSIPIVLPPAKEQLEIISFLDRETSKIDALIGKQEKLIATLREDRAATIAFTVTKGIDTTAELNFSGAPWIGDVPSHWTRSKVKHGFSVTLGKMYQGERVRSEDVKLPHLKAGSISEYGLDLSSPMMCWFNPSEVRSLDLRKGDVLVVEGGAIGRCAVLDKDLSGWGFQKSLNRVRPLHGDNPKFLAYQIETATRSGHVSNLCGKATIPHFTAEKLAELEWPHPTIAEQQEIVDYLDAHCAMVDALMVKSHEMIATLREYRSTLISNAVTGKIDTGGLKAVIADFHNFSGEEK